MDAHDRQLIAEAQHKPWDLINPSLAHSEEARKELEELEYMAYKRNRRGE